MNISLYDLWWLQVVRGISAIAFGILILVWPSATITAVAIIFASLFALYGVTDIISGIHGMTKHFSSILRVFLGILEIGIVIFLFKNAGSGLTLALMGLLMAVQLLVFAVVLIGAAFMADFSTGYKWALGLAGAVTFFVGITVARAPVVSIATVIFVLGIFGLFVGPIEIASGFILKSERDQLLKELES